MGIVREGTSDNGQRTSDFRRKTPSDVSLRLRPPPPEAGVQLTVVGYMGLLVFCLSLSYGVWPSRAPWGRLKL